jgi:hypothetical protein
VGFAALLVLAAACGSSGAGASRGSASSADPPPPAGSTAKHRHHHHTTRPKRDRHGRPRVPAADVPNRRLTPGAALTTSASVVCRSGYASRVRDVRESEKSAVYDRYGVAHVPYAHEVDHLVSLELGGSNAVANLWPEPYAGRWGARTKDVLENRLHDLVCSGAIRLRAAQRIEARNWVAAYRRYIGSPRAASGGGGSGGASGGGASGSGCEPGYSPCLPVAGDLDCPDIPAAKKPVRVSGSDPYRLDGDGDGLACE